MSAHNLHASFVNGLSATINFMHIKQASIHWAQQFGQALWLSIGAILVKQF
ncbi:hypothetical protein [Xanthomarina gelatinilytica]|uniref:hypothetical protein n=1 Tax=Xanthomarina gelatinilytica TaxID=1137281 RepID=UPI003AA8A8EE